MMFLREIKALIESKDLLYILVFKEFSIRYKQTVLGILWAIIQPLSLMFIFSFIFTVILPVNIGKIPRPVFYYSALLPWTFFASCLHYAIPSLVNHYNLIKKINFQKIFLPLSGIVVAFVDLLIATVIFLVMLMIYKIPFTLVMFWVIPLMFLLVLFTVAVSLILSALNVYYRDVNLAISFVIQLWFFMTPVFYSVDRVPERLKLFLFLNPLTFIVENTRRCLIEARPVVFWQYIIMLIFILSLFVFAYNFFKRTERKFADVI